MIGILYFILTVHSSCIYVCITMGLKWLIIVRTNDAYTMCIMCYNVLLLGAISVAIATPPCVSSLMCVCRGSCHNGGRNSLGMLDTVTEIMHSLQLQPE